MTTQKRIGFMLWGRNENERNAFSDDKYKDLADYFQRHDIAVETITYNNAFAEKAGASASQLDGVLVWVNPIEAGENREPLDQLLESLSARGIMVSCAPATIKKIGTKRVLYDTRNLPWGSDVQLYETYEAFKSEFAQTLQKSGTRVLKQYRGDGGNGIYKVSYLPGAASPVEVLHAQRGSTPARLTVDEANTFFQPYFADMRPLIDQAWHKDLANGVVRCYMSGMRVAGFGYQEINALYPSEGAQIQPGKRYYYSEQCGLFRDLKQSMEQRWLENLAVQCNVATTAFPVIWDCDFFINDVNDQQTQKYTLCEINVSCVSPFPESAMPHIYAEVKNRL
jgi:hypothetical protein